MLEFIFGKKSEPARPMVAPKIGNIVEGETVVSSDRIKMGELFGLDSVTDAGAAVTSTSAMRVSAVYAAVGRIAGAIAGLPKPIYARQPDGDRERVDHDFWWLLNERPCPSFSAAAFWEYITAQVLLRGDGIAYIARNRAGVPESFLPWPRDQVRIDRVVSASRQPARLLYSFHDTQLGGFFGADQDDVLHFPGFGFDGCKSMSVIQWGARNGIGIAIRGDEYAGKFFTQGGTPQIAVTSPGSMTPKQQEDLREAWIAKYARSSGPNGIPLILTEGLTVKEISMTAQDAQILESRQWQVVDIARAFGIPPFMIGEMGKATYNNTENLGVDFVKYTLSPHIKRFEQELNAKLFRIARNFVEFNVDGLQRGDLAARTAYYAKAVGGTQNPAWLTVDEIRRMENLPAKGEDTLAKPQPAATTMEETDEEPA